MQWKVCNIKNILVYLNDEYACTVIYHLILALTFQNSSKPLYLILHEYWIYKLQKRNLVIVRIWSVNWRAAGWMRQRRSRCFWMSKIFRPKTHLPRRKKMRKSTYTQVMFLLYFAFYIVIIGLNSKPMLCVWI